jgi:hypothetical protein
MKIQANIANAKRAHIQTLLYLALVPELEVLEAEVPASKAREREQYWIQKYSSPYLLNSTGGSEGVRGKPVSVYALRDPRSGVVFYVGFAINAAVRYKQHINDALTINAIIDKAERQRMRWTLHERELIFSGADAEAAARALGRTVEAVRSHFSLMISETGHASKFVIEALRAALNMRAASKLKRVPAVKFYPEEPNSNALPLSKELLEFARSLQK